MNHNDHRLIDSNNVKHYITGQKSPLEADFLLLSKEAQAEILENFNVSGIKELLDKINVPQLWTLELSILYRLSTNELLRRVWIVREKFKSQCGTELYQHYHDNLPKILQEESLCRDTALDDYQFSLLRDDTVSIARQLQRLAYVRICRSESINERKRFIIQATLFIMLLGFLVFQLLDSNLNLLFTSEVDKSGAKFLLLVICSGMTGSAMSILQRIEKVAHIPPLITDNIHDTMQITLNMSNWYVTSLLVSGAIFALLVHFLCIAQLVNVLDILPNMSKLNIPSGTSSLQQLVISPDNRIDLAKLLLAYFLSGFGERLVPDILDSLIKKTEISSSESSAKGKK